MSLYTLNILIQLFSFIIIMKNCKQKYTYEKSDIIPIHNKHETICKQYELKQNLFDPSKSSPPNNFLLKLKLRISHYDSFNNVINFVNE